MKRNVLAALIVFLPLLLLAQTNPSAQRAREWRSQNERAVVDEFIAFVHIPNVTQDRVNIQRNVEFLVKMMEKRGALVKTISVEDANPLVVGKIAVPGAKRTIAFYAHYDGQPVSEKDWASPPFTPTLRAQPKDGLGGILPMPPAGTAFDPESRIYARGAGDDKVCVMAMMSAVDAIRAQGLAMQSNIIFVFDGEEEPLSPHIAKMLATDKEYFAADVWLICDGPLHQSRRPLLYFGIRDAFRMDLTVYGARSELHSGHYGNWAPDPAMGLARLLASMKDENGRILVDHFYDDCEPLSETEKRAVADAPDIDKDLMRNLWLGSTEGSPLKLAELITRPSLNVMGLSSARVGLEASNVIPASATAAIGARLVKGMDPARTQEQIIEHIRKQGFYVVDKPPTPEIRQAHPKVILVEKGETGYGAVRTSMDLPISREVIQIVESVRGPAVKLPNMGGTIPLAAIEQTVGTHTIIVPIANHDDNQHTHNENIRIQNLWDGIELMAALMTM